MQAETYTAAISLYPKLIFAAADTLYMEKRNPSAVKVKLLREGASLPERQTEGAAGFDIRACIESPVTLLPFERACIPAGIALEIPTGYEGQVRPRSGLARNYGITLVNSPGTVDSDYRGEITVIIINLGKEIFTVRNGERIAQIIFAKTADISISAASSLGITERGEKGFGSTGNE